MGSLVGALSGSTATLLKRSESLFTPSLRSTLAKVPGARRLQRIARHLLVLPRAALVRFVQASRRLVVPRKAFATDWAEVRDPRFEEALPIDLAGVSPGAVRILAFFLPQFHRDAVNEQAWGRGFTEWRNVTKARPLFAAHQQPKLPADLGFTTSRIRMHGVSSKSLPRASELRVLCFTTTGLLVCASGGITANVARPPRD